jgi:stage IV sporulation protein B
VGQIKRGYPKEPGEISGTIYRDVVGQIKKNTTNGIYGKLENTEVPNKKKIKVAHKNDVKEGKAEIYLALDGVNVQKFDIDIKKVMYGSSGNKNMIVEITDKRLLEKTGGIVQGMSGSPIVQSGKLVGAITHVFLNEPRQGYAVFAENMIMDMNSILEKNEE